MNNKEKIDKNELKLACESLGLNYSEFIETPSEIEKGVVDGVDYKTLYNQQLENNNKILLALGSTNKKSFEVISELQKGFDFLQEEFSKLGSSPMHNRKSFDKEKISILEKSFQPGNGGFPQASSMLSIKDNNKQVKNFLGDRMMEELRKGITNGLYEKAAMELDAKGFISNDKIAQIATQDKIQIVN